MFNGTFDRCVRGENLQPQASPQPIRKSDDNEWMALGEILKSEGYFGQEKVDVQKPRIGQDIGRPGHEDKRPKQPEAEGPKKNLSRAELHNAVVKDLVSRVNNLKPDKDGEHNLGSQKQWLKDVAKKLGTSVDAIYVAVKDSKVQERVDKAVNGKNWSFD